MARSPTGSEQQPPTLCLKKKLTKAKRKKAKASATGPSTSMPSPCPSPALEKRKQKHSSSATVQGAGKPAKARGLKKRRVTCFICFEKIPLGKPYRLKCQHSGFHKACILQWLRRSARCPLCDTEFPEYVRQPVEEKMTIPSLHHLPLSVLYAYPELAQSMGVPIVYDP